MREEKLKRLLTWAGGLGLVIFTLSPFAWMLAVSFSQAPDFPSHPSSFAFTLRNYAEILFSQTLHFVDYLRNSMLVSSVSAVLATLFASAAAYAIARLRFPGRVVIPLGILGLSMFPQISVVGYLFKMMTGLGWINTYAALIFPYVTLTLPFALWIMLSYFSQLPKDLDRAAFVDGATRFQTLRKVIFPLALPGAFSTLLLAFIFSFNEFLFALMLTVDYKARTIPVGIALFQGLHGEIPWGQVMAGAALASVPLAALTATFQRYIIQGLTQGALKG
jgi:multiple sugar transport system permease protein